MRKNSTNSELRALLSIKKINNILEKHYTEMMQIEDNINELNLNASRIIICNCSSDLQHKWKTIFKEVNNSMFIVSQIINSLKEKVAKKDISDASDLWKLYDIHLDKLTITAKKMEYFGFENLPIKQHKIWEKEICNFEINFLPIITSHADKCRIELQLIKKYTPKELTKVNRKTKNNLSENIKNEYDKDKNIWDKFLNVI